MNNTAIDNINSIDGLLRLRQIIGRKADPKKPKMEAIPAIIPVSKTGWYDGIKKGIYPKPVKLSSKVVAWRASDIRKLVEKKDF